MAAAYASLDYVRGFRCLGADCEDVCCRGWDLGIDRRRHDLLARRVEGDPEMAARFERAVLPADGDDERRFARIRVGADGSCAFLDADGLCAIQRRYGQSLLPLTCVAYPRVVSRRHEVDEIAGALSCPEMARRCLLGPHSGEPAAIPVEELPEGSGLPVIRVLPEVPPDPYHRHFLEVREALLALVAEPETPLELRWLRLVYFTHRISPFYHRGCGEEAGPRLAAERERLGLAALQTGLEERLDRAGPEEPLAIMLVQALLALRLQRFPEEAFSATVRAVFDDFAREIAPLGPEGAGVEFPPSELAAAFARRRQRVEAVFGERIDHYLGRYLANCLHREWFVSMPDAFTYTHLLTVRLAVLRFLFHGHPAVAELAAAGASEAAMAELDRIAVEVIYRFSRAFDHDVGFQEAIYRALVEQDLLRFDVVPRLLRF
ncbi:MAG TPA: flagellin lysine-N-methylase [Gammaproteobacteria bacterium]|nr:flagellin lysine-N-methylase [Gammaproteobacteria bacterium]